MINTGETYTLFTGFPSTSNLDLSWIKRPTRLSLAEFNKYSVSDQELKLRNKIYALEAAMFTLPQAISGTELDEVMVPIHRFCLGIYSRELTIPKGMIVVGKRHAIEHLVMVIHGECLVATERGIEILKAPCTFISPAGEKRVVYATEEVTWVTVHRTDKTTLDEVEADVIIAEPDRALEYERKKVIL